MAFEFDSSLFYNHLAQTTPYPMGITVDRAKGIYLYDSQGHAYMDLISGIAVSNIGHCHPKVIEAIKRQVDKHLHVMVYGEYIQSTPNLLIQKLHEVTPANIDCFYLVNSGTEANEGALKLAKRATGRAELIAFNKSYHGSTHGSLSASGNEIKKNEFRPLLPGVNFMNFNKENELEKITNKTAAVIIEVIQGDAGVRIPTVQYMQSLRERCTDVGALLIIDEIQTGFGRTGTFWAFEQYGIVPDILTMAKAMGGGLPLGSFAASKALMSLLAESSTPGHITTFGGNPVSCAASLATIEVIQEERLLENVEQKGKLFEALLVSEHIKQIRRSGLMLAIEFANFDIVQQIIQYCLEHRVICFWFLSCPNAFRVAPPLTISKEEIEEACAVITAGIARVCQ